MIATLWFRDAREPAARPTRPPRTRTTVVRPSTVGGPTAAFCAMIHCGAIRPFTIALAVIDLEPA